ncbi:hypothetical protein B0T16DRAFT_451888 [Cercophora newfieldiana]|uniref:Ankyrin repeat protein n=1 Tax=Cercophora newfieldiana TaxID=92897 RepID=A0AA40CYN5_9PEZI|nr:hypothetical protein B0T16DRAFT_451888 [Cercophora newfieldiana]
MATCRGLQATIVDFFIGASEQRIQVSTSVYDLIYGRGPHATMNTARGYDLNDTEPSFRWYHLPANNLEWVEDLLERHMEEVDPGVRLLSEESRQEHGLSRHRHLRTKAGRLTFKRPETTCYPAKTDADDVADEDTADYIFSVVPFLHFDTEEAFDDMAKTLDEALEGRLAPETDDGPVINARTSPRQVQRRLLTEYIGSGGAGEAPSLQPRRTLDQYFYTHLGSTRQRDKDQVVLRYTGRTPGTEPKLFMVDQLWLAHTITTFCIDTFDPHRVPEDYQFLDFFQRSIGKVRDACARSLQRFRSAPGKGFDERDSMYRVPPEISYMDDYRHSTGLGDHLSIEVETQQFVEIEDIRDELSILQLVLEDQGEVLRQMEEVLVGKDRTRPSPLAQNRVLEGHLRRIKKIEAMATRTSELLYHLIDLKQKQASILEALAMRKQADILALHAEEWAVQAKEAQEQTDQAIKQGRTVLLFTVVAIVILPLSFMAAFFAIEIDVFPLNEYGKLDLGYVLTYMLSISAGLSIPFIFIVFNQDRVWGWLRGLRAFALRLPLSVYAVLLLMGVLLGTIWGLELDRTVKISVTIPVVLLGVVSLIVIGLRKLFSIARQESVSSGSTIRRDSLL